MLDPVCMEPQTWCPECGPAVKVDEDLCCAQCGASASGEGADQALELLNGVSDLLMIIKGLVCQGKYGCDFEHGVMFPEKWCQVCRAKKHVGAIYRTGKLMPL